jgi:biopolymer transport protein ExbD
MLLSAQRVRSKSRAAIKKREDDIEDDERESGELNLIPYLDMVTNLMLFLLASVSAGLILVQIDSTLPDKKVDSGAVQNPVTDPNKQPLKLVVSITRDQMLLWSITGLEGTLKEPKARFPRTGREGDACDGTYMCESNACNPDVRNNQGFQGACVASRDLPTPVFDYRGLNKVLYDIAASRYTGQQRASDTYQIILMADGGIPYGTIIPVMAAMRCKLPDFGKESPGCILPTEDPELKKAKEPFSPEGCGQPNKSECKLYDSSRAAYDPKKMALFHDILFSSGFE